MNQTHIAEKQTLIAKQNEEKANKATQKEEYGAYIARIGLAAAKIEDNAFDRALSLLEECPPGLRNWEWGRLRYLCTQGSRTIDAIDPSRPWRSPATASGSPAADGAERRGFGTRRRAGSCWRYAPAATAFSPSRSRPTAGIWPLERTPSRNTSRFIMPRTGDWRKRCPAIATPF